MKFVSLFKKELREMLSVQTIIMLVFLLVIMSLMGVMLNSSVEESESESSKITICDLDGTDFTESVLAYLEHPTADMQNEVEIISLESDDYAAELDRLDIKTFIVIPEGFTDCIVNGEQADIVYVSKMTSLASMANINTGSETAVALIEAAVKTALYTDKVQSGILTDDEVTVLESPLNVTEQTVVGDKSEEISQLLLYSCVYSQSLMLPLVVYILILLGSQTMVNAVAAEKLDKTLETLLSAPVSRLTVLSAKMLAAAVVALLNAAIYMVGTDSMTSAVTGTLSGDYSDILNSLGLSFTTKSYILIGIQMLLSTLIALSVSLILGAFAKNVKSSQTLMMPIMFTALFPFMASMFVDISTLPGAVRYLLYAIPFTHTFMATDNVIFGKASLYVGGLIYQLVFLVICMTIAIKIFTSDKIFTASEGVGGRRRKKSKQAKE